MCVCVCVCVCIEVWEEKNLRETPPFSYSFLFVMLENSFQFSSVTQSCPTLCDPMNCSMPGLPVHHQLLEFTQTHVHRVGDAIQPSHPRSFPSPPTPNLSQHQSLFQCALEKEMATHSSILVGKSHGQSLVDYSPWACKESDMTE